MDPLFHRPSNTSLTSIDLCEAVMPLSDPPIPHADLRALFERLDRASIAGYQCPHTFALTTAFLRERGIPVEPMLRWLRANGAGCDCEVMFNTAESWGEIVGHVSPDAGL